MELIGEYIDLDERSEINKLYQDKDKFYLIFRDGREEIEKKHVVYGLTHPFYDIEYSITANKASEDINNKYLCRYRSPVYDTIAITIYGYGSSPVEALNNATNNVKKIVED